MTRVAIVGGGIAGLASALFLLESDPALEVEVFEREMQTGGKLRTDQVDGFVVERGPDAFLASKPGAIGLSRHLGLDGQAISPISENRQSFVMRDGGLMPLPQGLSGLVPGDLKPILESPLLSSEGKARLARETEIPVRRDQGEESIASFMRRRYGQEAWDRMIEPLLTGIYAGDGERLSIDATFPNLPAQELQYGSLLVAAIAARDREQSESARPSTPKGFVSFRQGMETLPAATRAAVEQLGGKITVGAAVQAIEYDLGSRQFELSINGSASPVRVDAVVLATPAWVGSALLKYVSPGASDALAEIEHSSSGLVALGFPETQLTKALNGYGYVVPRAEGRDITAMTWVSSKWSGRAPAGQALVRVFLGRTGREAVLQLEDADLIKLAIAEMREVLGLRIEPTLTRVQRWELAMPQYVIGHRERVSRIESGVAAVPGLAITGTMLRGVGKPDVISSARSAADKVLRDVAPNS